MAEQSTIYRETTIPSFLTARLSGDLIAAGRQWWEQSRSAFDLFVSEIVAGFNAVNLREGYPALRIFSPLEVV